MFGLRRYWLVAVLLCLAACGSTGQAASGVTQEDTWRSSSSGDGMLTVSAPGDWALTEDQGATVVLTTPQGGTLSLERSALGSKGGLTQPQILEGMLSEVTAEFADRNQTIEEVGRRVWMGEHYIWHEIQYIANPTGECDDCRPAFYVDILAFPETGGVVRGRFMSADAQPLGEEAEALLSRVIDSITVRAPGTT
ncbi:MAG: hypothetical protein ACYC5O_09785 [Anaerolineae bacterium]